jgi:ABC-type branched-subunit amino acid transport system substrate-binding protein
MNLNYSALRTLKIYGVIMVLLALSACGEKGLAGAPPTLKIGLVAPFEGLHRPLGYEALFAVKLAVQERNAAGGVNGCQVELVALNDFDNPVEAHNQAKALVSDPNVVGVVGHLAAEATLAALPVYQKADLAMVVPWAVPSVDEATGVVQVAATATEAAARLETLRQEQGFIQIMTVSDAQVGPISAGTQALVLNTDGVTAGEISLALRDEGVMLPLLGYVDVGSPQLVQVARQAAAGLQYVSPGPDPTTANESAAFVDAYQSLAGFLPGPRAVLVYDATHVLLDAIEQAMNEQPCQPGREQVSAVINKIERQGISGNILFDTRGQRVNAPVWIYQISEEGRYPGMLVAAPEE